MEYKVCTKCNELLEVSNFYLKNVKGVTKLASACRACESLRNREYRNNNPDKQKKRTSLRQKTIYIPNVNKTCAACNKSLSNTKFHKSSFGVYGTKSKCKTCANTEYKNYSALEGKGSKERVAKWAKENKHKVNFNAAKRRSIKLQAVPMWDKEFNLFIIEEIYDLAQKRSKLFNIEMHVDHIVPLQSELVCGLHHYNNLQIIKGRDNISKRNRFWPDMPD